MHKTSFFWGFFPTTATWKQSVDQRRNTIEDQSADAKAAQSADVWAWHAWVRFPSESPEKETQSLNYE